MKAPDKIYMPNELLSEEWQRHVEGQDTAYIRKDALLEWAKKKQKQCMEDSIAIVYFTMFEDKINSL